MKFPHRLCLASCLLLAIGFGRPTFGEEPSAFSAHGPLHYRNHNPIYLQIANIVPMRVVPLPKGVAEAAVGISYANIFEQFTTVSHDVLLDMEILRPTLSLAYGMGRGMAISVELPFTHGGGGIIDGFLEGFHNAFGLPNAGRENFPRDQFVYRMRRPDGTLFESGAPSFVPGDLMMTLRQEVLPEVRRRPAIGWFAVIEPPTAKASAGWGN
ncbi:MAG: DUF3187 family protein, partial [Deltaproteobacteria bacterium]|nr:DUF3187 family protein [Deltaproteobacteria bacterium]